MWTLRCMYWLTNRHMSSFLMGSKFLDPKTHIPTILHQKNMKKPLNLYSTILNNKTCSNHHINTISNQIKKTSSTSIYYSKHQWRWKSLPLSFSQRWIHRHQNQSIWWPESRHQEFSLSLNFINDFLSSK